MNRLQKKSGVGGCEVGWGRAAPGPETSSQLPGQLLWLMLRHTIISTSLYLWLLLCSVAAAHRHRRERACVFCACAGQSYISTTTLKHQTWTVIQTNSRLRSNNKLHKFEHQVKDVQTILTPKNMQDRALLTIVSLPLCSLPVLDLKSPNRFRYTVHL